MQAKKEYFFKTMQTKTGKNQVVCGISTEVVTAELLDEISKNNFDIAVFDKNVVEFADGSFKERNCGKFYFGSAINLQKIGTEAFALADDVCVAQAFLNVEEIGESAFFETRCNMHAALPNANVLHMPKLKKAPAYCFSGCYISKIALENLQEADPSAFSNAHIRSVEVPRNIYEQCNLFEIESHEYIKRNNTVRLQ